MFPIYAQSGDLCIKIGEISTLKKRVVAKANAWNDVTCTEGRLLDLREELIHRAVENKLSYRLDRNELFRPNLGSIKDIKVKVMFILLFKDLDCEGPLWRAPIFDCLVEVLPVEV